MTALVITINGVPFDLTRFLPAGGNGKCEIKLNGKGSDHDIKIWGNRPMRTEFHPGNYRKIQNTNRYENSEADNFINKVVVETDLLGHFEISDLTGLQRVEIDTATN